MFLNLNKFLDPYLNKFPLFDLAKILYNLFLLFTLLLHLLKSILFFSTISINTSNYFTNLLIVVLNIKISGLVI